MLPKNKWILTIVFFDFVLLSLLLITLFQTQFRFSKTSARFIQTGSSQLDSSQANSSLSSSSQADPAQTDSSQQPSNNLEDKKIALTFDDGPHPYYTEQLLDGLIDRGVVVTFFVTGEHAILHPHVISRMQEEGHLIGNHTYSHLQLTRKNRAKFKQELIDTNKVISDITGESPSYVRPPYGTWDKSFEKELNMIPVLWTVDPLDWCSDNVACITSNVITKVEENDIILMHDYYDSSVTAALEIVDQLLEEGYIFVTVEEILFE